MKIVFFGWTGTCDPMKIGGNESFVRRLVLSLTKQDHNVVVILYGADEDYELENALDSNISIKYYRSFYNAIKVIAQLRYDFVTELYIHKLYYIQYLIFKWKMRSYIKFSIIFMMFTENIIKKWLRNKIRVRFCNFVFAVSPRLVKELRKNNISAIWLPPSVPDYYFSRSIYKEVKPKTVVSFIGRIDPSKGLADILESLKYSLETNDLSVLKIYGYFIPGNKESVALHNVLKNLNYVDYRAYSYDTYHYSLKGEEQLLDFISEADILILPYRDLTGTIDLPLLLLEALATGCVVISTDVGDIQNILGIHELIVKSPEEMIERIKSLSNFGMVKKYSDRIKAMNLFDTFSSKKVTEKFLSALECKSRIQ